MLLSQTIADCVFRWPQDEAVASDFVTRFHLQHILTLEGQQQQ